MKSIWNTNDLKYGKIILLACIFLTVFNEVSCQKGVIDCRKFVFAPPCRGAAAKRDVRQNVDGYSLLASKLLWDLAKKYPDTPDA